MKIKHLIGIIYLIGLLISCQSQGNKQETMPIITTPIEAIDEKKVNPYANAKVSYQLIPSEGDTWGYDILIDGNMVIHQPLRPALSGNSGFDTKEKAQKIANLVIEKIKKGEMPPTISTEEMQKAGVL